MTALLSPLQLQAATALLQNQGIHVNSNLKEQITLYQANPTVAAIRDTIVNGANVLANTTIATLQTLASSSCPALADSVPQAFVNPYPPTTTVNTVFSVTSPNTSDPGLTGMITVIADSYLGNGDIGKFSQLLSAAQGYCVTTNVFINSAVNAKTGYLGDTFTDMDNLVTGDLTQVNLDTKNFGNDLANLGEAISLSTLDEFGSPLALLQQLIKKSGVTTPIIIALANQGISENIILELGNPELVITDTVQKQIYAAMTTITGDDLTQILAILGVTTVNITCLADLLNPVKLFPNSYSTLTTPVCSGNSCYPKSNVTIDIGQVIFQTRTPPTSDNPVYPVSNEAWSPFMNTNGVWEFPGGTVFSTRAQTDVTPQSYPAWSPFMNTNSVWNSDILSLSFVRNYTVTFPVSGMYSFTAQCDNYATVSLNDAQILYISGFQGDPQVTNIYVNAGTYTLNINATNSGSYSGGNPAAFALIVASAPGSGSSSFSRTYTINAPASGTYTITAQADNIGEVIIDNDLANAFAFAGFTGTPYTKNITLTQGTHEIEINGTNSGGPAGIAVTVVSGFSTRPTPKCGLRGIYIPNITGYSSDVAVPQLTEVEYNYRKLFGRASDNQGYQYWIASGLTGAKLIDAMLESALPRDLQYYQTRLRLGTFPIYSNQIGPTPTGAVTSSVNTALINQLPDNSLGINYSRLSKIIPEDQALADRALAVSLQQITNIGKITLQQLARAYQNIETNKDLPSINSQFQPVSQDTLDYFKNGMAKGTGENGTILLADVIGSAGGVVVNSALRNVITAISNLSGDLDNLTEIYEVMLGVVNGNYPDSSNPPDGIDIPSGLPGTGTYANADAAILALVALARAEITLIQSGDLANTAILNEAFTSIGTQLAQEYYFQKAATIDVNQLSGNSQASIQTLIFALPAYGKDTDAGGVAEFLEDIADITTPGGQAVVATLREGRNRTVLNESGLNGSVNISSDSAIPPPQATLIPSEYNQTEALARIVT
jgi:hypothetical protein